MSQSQPGTVAGAVARTVGVLRVLAAQADPVTVSDLARATSLPKTTAHRILNALAGLGVTVRTDSGHALSNEWAGLLRRDGVWETVRLRRLLIPHVVDLYVRTGLVCGLAVRRGLDVVFVASVYGHNEVHDVGHLSDRVPAQRTAAGLLLLAHAPDGLVRSGLAADGDDPARLQRRLAEIRAIGLAVSMGERVPGTVGLAAPVLSRGGRVAAALSVGGRAVRVDIHHVGVVLRQTADTASVSLRWFERHGRLDRLSNMRP